MAVIYKYGVAFVHYNYAFRETWLDINNLQSPKSLQVKSKNCYFPPPKKSNFTIMNTSKKGRAIIFARHPLSGFLRIAPSPITQLMCIHCEDFDENSFSLSLY
jgi:hypothetical protein